MPGIPAGLRYSPDHLRVRLDAGAGLIRAGVTDFARHASVAEFADPDGNTWLVQEIGFRRPGAGRPG
jgi:hypothetical protein